MVKPQPWSQSRIFPGCAHRACGKGPMSIQSSRGCIRTPSTGSRAGPSSWAAGLSASQRLASASREPVSGPGCGSYSL